MLVCFVYFCFICFGYCWLVAVFIVVFSYTVSMLERWVSVVNCVMFASLLCFSICVVVPFLFVRSMFVACAFVICCLFFGFICLVYGCESGGCLL